MKQIDAMKGYAVVKVSDQVDMWRMIMKACNPWLTPAGQKWIFSILFVLALVTLSILNIIDLHLTTPVAPQNIVSFELAGTLSKAQAILEAWGSSGKVYAGLSLGFDFFFIVVYAGAIALACILLARSLKKPPLVLIGVILAWMQLVAALMDSTENFALIQLLLGSSRELWPSLARSCAIVKFSLVGLGLIYIILGAFLVLVARVGKAK